MKDPRGLEAQFEDLILKYLKVSGFDTERHTHALSYDRTYYDIRAVKNKHTTLLEVKFYRSNKVHRALVTKAAETLAKAIKSGDEKAAGVVAVNIDLSKAQMAEIYERFGIQVWDRGRLAFMMELSAPQLKEDFELLLLESQQDMGYRPPVFSNLSPALEEELTREVVVKDVGQGENPDHSKAHLLIERLEGLGKGRDHWRSYEELMMEILKFIFKKDLGLWEKQQNTEDGLSRFDLICRIIPFDDFWKSLIRSFNSRFILFEFKNYTDQFSQNEVYLTERYLYRNALRSVAIMISRMGPNNGAVQAAKGALREHGKLIFFLDDSDMIVLLRALINNDNPSDYLAVKLDDWLAGLSR